MELGIYTFGELTDPDAHASQERLANLLEEIELADQVGLDVFGVGEHHRPDFAVSAPAVVLAAAAARTKRIRLTSAVTVLSSDDPVRVFQDFATLDLLSGGRAEIMAGRGSLHRVLPAVRLRPRRLRRAVRREARPAARAARGRARHLGGAPPARRSTTSASTRGRSRTRCRSGSPSAARRSRSSAPASLGLPMALAIIGGQPERFAPFAELHRRAAERGRPRAAGAEHQLARLHRRRLAGRRSTRPSRRTRS